MRQNGFFLAFFLSLLFIEQFAHAQVFTLKEIMAIASKDNQDLIAARAGVAIAQSNLVQASLFPNPSLQLNNNDDRVFTNEGEYSRSININQPLPISGRIGQQKKVAQLDVVRTQLEIRELERQMDKKIALAFYDAIISQKRLRQVHYLLKINRELLQVIHNRYHAAEISELDLNAARIEYEKIKQERIILETQRTNQLMTLNLLMGRSKSAPLRLKDDLQIHKKIPAVHTLLAIAWQNRPDRKSLHIQMGKGRADMRLAQLERMADWSLGIGVQQDRIVVDGGPRQTPDKTLNVNLTVPIPIFNQNQGRISAAQATSMQAVLALRALDLSIQTDIKNFRHQLEVLQKNLAEAQKSTLALSVANIKLAKEAYTKGQISFLNMLQVQRQQNDVQNVYLNALEKYYQIYIALCTSLGFGETKGFCPNLSYSRNCHARIKKY